MKSADTTKKSRGMDGNREERREGGREGGREGEERRGVRREGGGV